MFFSVRLQKHVIYILSSWADFTSLWGKWHKHMSPSRSPQMEDLSHSTLLFSYGDTSVPVQTGGGRLQWANAYVGLLRHLWVRVHLSDIGSGACSPHSSFPFVVIFLLTRRMRCMTSWVLAHITSARSAGRRATCIISLPPSPGRFTHSDGLFFSEAHQSQALLSPFSLFCMAALSTWPQGWGCDKEAFGDMDFL